MYDDFPRNLIKFMDKLLARFARRSLVTSRADLSRADFGVSEASELVHHHLGSLRQLPECMGQPAL